VGERLDFDKDQAEAAVVAVLQVLRSRITGREASHLDAQLPIGLKRFWQDLGFETEVAPSTGILKRSSLAGCGKTSIPH